MKTILTLCSVLGVILANQAAAKPVIGTGGEKAGVCVGCHGEAGQGANPLFPKLAGQNARYLSRQLRYFKDQTRAVPAMNAIAATLSDDDIAGLSAYFASQQPQPESGESSPEGERIYRAGLTAKQVPACTGCHGPEGQGNAPAGFPLLKGQYADYTVKALSDYAAGIRGETTPMQAIAARMSKQEMQAVAAYIAGLR